MHDEHFFTDIIQTTIDSHCSFCSVLLQEDGADEFVNLRRVAFGVTAKLLREL